MKSTALKCLLILITTLSTTAWAQEQASGSSQGYFDIGVKTGSFLPYDIPGVREVLPIFGVKLGHSVSETMGLEYDLDAANAKGAKYYNAYFSLRHNFAVGNVIPLFFLIGVDIHRYKRAPTYGSITNTITEYDFQTTSGWHVAFGSETIIYGDIWFRSDVRMGFSPGRQLTVSFSGIYRF